MSEFTPLREAVDTLASRTPLPEFGELKRRATRRGRRRVAVAAAAAVAFIAAGGGLAAGTLGGSDQPSPIGEPTTPSSGSPTVQESAESQASLDAFGEELDAILAQVPGWAISKGPFPTGYDYAFNGPCSGNWTKGAAGGGDGGIGSSGAGLGSAGWPTEAQASEAAARFAENLTSCTATEWRTRLIEQQPGAVLASSADAVTWIRQMGSDVRVLQIRTTGGPPPLGVQVDVAQWMVDYNAWQNGTPEP